MKIKMSYLIPISLITILLLFSPPPSQAAIVKNPQNYKITEIENWDKETNFINLNIKLFQIFSSSQNIKTNSPPSSVKIAINKTDNLIYLAEFNGKNKIIVVRHSEGKLYFLKELELPKSFNQNLFDNTYILDLHYSEQGEKALYVSIAYNSSKAKECEQLIVYKINSSLQKIKPIFSSEPCSAGTIGDMDGRIASNEDYIFLTGSNSIIDNYTVTPHPERLINISDCSIKKENINKINLDKCIEHSNLFNHVIKISKKNLISTKISKGHRRAQGLLWDSYRKILWETEQGPRGGDELNNIIDQRDYGWPYTSLGRWYTLDMLISNMTPPIKYNNHDKFEEPTFAWLPSVGVSQLTAISQNSSLKEWQNDLIVSTLKDQSLYRLKISQAKNNILYSERIDIGYRIRDLESDDKFIYAATDDGKLIIIGQSLNQNIENPFPAVDFMPRHVLVEPITKSENKLTTLMRNVKAKWDSFKN
jgi:glucose/arabinose dehydrogenase